MMKSATRTVVAAVAVLAACTASFVAGLRAQGPQESIEGGRFQSGPGGLTLDVLFHGEAREVPVDIGILTFPEGTNTGDHQHPQTEIFYVVEGQLEHVVNGESTILDPGELGFVSPPDLVNHVTAAGIGPTRALVIWAPAGNAGSIASRWERVSGGDDD
jgi:quercetin dioxygenase-like cupin family protein